MRCTIKTKAGNFVRVKNDGRWNLVDEEYATKFGSRSDAQSFIAGTGLYETEIVRAA